MKIKNWTDVMSTCIGTPCAPSTQLILTGSEGDVIRAIRNWIMDACRLGKLPDLPLGDTEGDTPPEALNRFLHHLTRHGRRALQFGSGLCRAITADEQAVLNLIAASQQDGPDHAKALIAWLFKSDQALQAELLSKKLGETLASRGMVLPHRLSAPPIRRNQPSMIVLSANGIKAGARA